MLTDIKNILMPTDFSENANRALPFATELARKTGATLIPLYCVEEPFDFAPMVEDYKEQIVERVTKLFDEMLDELQSKKKLKGLRINTKILSGHPVTNILQEARENEGGLIVMGTKGATGARKLLFGSFTTDTIMHSEIPVLAVPEGSSYNNFKNIVYATDFHEADLRKLSEVVHLAGLFNSKVRVIHVAEHDTLETEIKFRGFRELAREKHPDANIKFELVRESDFFAGIAGYLEEKSVDLVVMIRYKKSFWESLVTRSFSKELAFYTQIPLMVLAGEEPAHSSMTETNDRNKEKAKN